MDILGCPGMGWERANMCRYGTREGGEDWPEAPMCKPIAVAGIASSRDGSYTREGE